MIRDYINIPWKEIKRKRMRSWLTLIGIFIGGTSGWFPARQAAKLHPVDALRK